VVDDNGMFWDVRYPVGYSMHYESEGVLIEDVTDCAARERQKIKIDGEYDYVFHYLQGDIDED
jgi:hypothetical protein